jgi:hypothetical protein
VLDGRQAAVFVFEGEISRHVGVELRGRRGERIRGIDDDREIAVIDRDPLGCLLRGPLAFRHHECDRFADVAHAAERQRVAVRHLQRRTVLALERDRVRAPETGVDQILAHEDREHAGGRRRCGDVDRRDLGMGAVRAHEVPVGLPRQIPVGGVAPLSGDKAEILAPAFE